MNQKGKVLFIVHDVYQEDNRFPQGVGCLAAVLKKEGADVKVCCQDIYHYSKLVAVVLGACVAERHITLDRLMWGSDQAASLEPRGLELMVRDIRVLPKCFGDGVKKVYESEFLVLQKLRKVR